MEDIDLKGQINIFRNTEKIIFVYGAALTHLAFAKPGTMIIDLIYKDFNQLCFYKLSKTLKIDYCFFRCAGSEDAELWPDYQYLKIDVKEFTAFLQKW